MKVSGQTVPTPSDARSVVSKDYADDLIVGMGSFHGQTVLSASQTFTFDFGAAPVDGRLIGVSVRVKNSRLAGTITAEAKVAGSAELTAVIDGTNPDVNRDVDLANTVGPEFAAGDLLTVTVTADGTWSPVAVTLFVQLHYATYDLGSLPALPGARDFIAAELTTRVNVSTINNPIPWDTVNRSNGSSISLNTGVGDFTLAPGLYFVNAHCPHYRDDGTATIRKIDLYNVTDDMWEANIAGMFVGDAGDATGGGSSAVICFISVTKTTNYELRQTTATARSDFGPDGTLSIVRLDV